MLFHAHVGFLDDNQGESRDHDKDYDMHGSHDLIGDGLTPPDTEMNSDGDGRQLYIKVTVFFFFFFFERFFKFVSIEISHKCSL